MRTVAAILLLPVLIGSLSCRHPTEEQLLTSCQNHSAQLEIELNLSGLGTRTNLPHEMSVPGHAVFARYSGKVSGKLNCNHGAPASRIGGWQAMSLSPAMWNELRRKWNTRSGEQGLPFYWCGRPNPQQKRVVCELSLEQDGWKVNHRLLIESEVIERVRRLNDCLHELGMAEVSINVPDGVRWSAFDQSAAP